MRTAASACARTCPSARPPLDLAHGVADVGFGAAPFDPAGAHLVLRKAFLQRGLGAL